MESKVKSKVFGNKFGGDKNGYRPVFDVVMFDDYLESTAPYASQLPKDETIDENEPIELPNGEQR